MRTAALFLVLASVMAAPWLVARALGWDADAAVLANGAGPTPAVILHALVALATHVVAWTLAPGALAAAAIQAVATAVAPPRDG